MDDDFNTPKAVAVLFQIMRKCNAAMNGDGLPRPTLDAVLEALKKIDRVLGVLPPWNT